MPIVGSRFSDRAHYNEFVESRSKSWALMRRRLVLGVKNTQNRATHRLRKKGPLARGQECANPSRSHRSLLPFSGPPYSSWCSLFFLAPFSSSPPLLLRLIFFWVISVVIYSFLPFILLLHLSVIYASLQVHVLSAILSGAL